MHNDHRNMTMTAALALACMTMLAACASTPSAMPNVRYDLGVAPAIDQSANSTPATTPATTPPVKVLAVSAPRNLETDDFIYRLSYVDAQRTGNYSNSHWTMPPAQLLTQRLRDSLSARGPVLTGADPVRAALLEIELTRFEQVFDAPERSHGLVAVRATLTQQGRVVAQRSFSTEASAPTGDAAGGARALAAASNEMISQLSAWLDKQPLTAAAK
ncbi:MULTISPECIES: ABC-type transport auxiliary lipoprotein family protein [unclassified Caballeronia]|uniref:ABC-type transport auxiliary lipoprotein family protein n=1 Tax=unclassified Caballeronia TaxID=2646786 RepID=UPI0028600955|nr:MULTISPECIES: ABC-type transport auxiliary lipoprotein family protein [unclassified Caballeronia]MDR5770352.1 ABC-type transport auxiliary lipoprotein family protein [Caballeronia sp. LZ002]MDR5845789.1 ABC-type transport auxiliary lipoprotein family protein [Caballeronia sp. LZ003]